MPGRRSKSVKETTLVTPGAAPASKKKKLPPVVTQLTHGTLFAVGLAMAQADTEEAFFKKKFFEPGLIDRLRTQITRYHE